LRLRYNAIADANTTALIIYGSMSDLLWLGRLCANPPQIENVRPFDAGVLPWFKIDNPSGFPAIDVVIMSHDARSRS
jgi:hypothetical protein